MSQRHAGMLGGIGGLVAPMHLVERPLEQHVSGVIFDLIVRALAGHGVRPDDGLELDHNGRSDQRFHFRKIVRVRPAHLPGRLKTC